MREEILHHTLRFYSTNQELAVRFYILGAKFAKIPFVGRYFAALLNRYALTQHAAFILTYDEVRKVIGAATSIAVGDCKCRKVFHNCDGPIRADIVFGIGFDVFTEVRKEEYTKISGDEALNIIDDCKRHGLVQSLLKCRKDFYAICNCCPCCCVPLRLRKDYGIKGAWVKDADVVDKVLR